MTTPRPRRRSCLSLLATLLIASATTPTRAGYMYWTTGFGRTIERANLDGTGRTTLTHTTNLPGEIAFDPINRQIYWTSVQGRGISRVNADGTGSQKILTPGGNPEGIALDVAAGKMYWAEGPATNRIRRANLDGSAAETLITVPTGYPQAVALDTLHNHMYWMNIETSTIFRSTLDGADTVPILTTGISPISIVLDVAGNKMYWTENGQNNRLIRRAALDGSNIETLVTGLGNPLGLALDLGAGKMYWSDLNLQRIQRSNLDGSGVETLLTNLGNPEFLALDIPEPATAILLLIGLTPLTRRPTTPRNHLAYSQ